MITVAGGDAGRVNLAGLLCYRPGHRSRLIYRTHINHRRKHEKASFTEADYIRLLDETHQVLHAPIVLIWDNLNRHTSAKIQAYLDNRDWLTVIRLPSYAPDLNPVEGVWSVLKASLGNLLTSSIDELANIIRSRLSVMQRRRDGLLDGFLAETGLTLEPITP